ncbi:alpha-N-acetylneuraminide alpha-2,8-sialyltransferase-like [Antedon mediterranea]|uniref:alpha-N-acetylneuraminide alpha-2,8-sialyltransferase-like n=1 Tax=Antedon mediterranea TaxID=105859 RepID=UPI003AF64DED
MAKYKGYEKDVGNRTDLSGINYVKCNQVLQCFSKQKKKCPAYKELLALRKSIILLTVFTDGLKTKARFRRHMAFVDMLYKSGIKFDIRVSAEGATAAIKMFWKLSKMPTAGIRGIAIALTMCRSVSAYGFYTSTVSPSGKPVPYHYFDHMKLGGYRSHNFSEEQVVLSELNRNQVIRMVTDRCN